MLLHTKRAKRSSLYTLPISHYANVTIKDNLLFIVTTSYETYSLHLLDDEKRVDT